MLAKIGSRMVVYLGQKEMGQMIGLHLYIVTIGSSLWYTCNKMLVGRCVCGCSSNRVVRIGK